MSNIRKGIISVALVLTALSLCTLFFVFGERSGRAQESVLWSARTERAERDVASLQAENEALAQAAEQAAPPENPAGQALLDDLQKQQALIPIEAALGGTMRFFPSLCKVLNERYVYAYAEDGHVSADMIFRYRQNEDGSIDWSLAMYDTGNGWETT